MTLSDPDREAVDLMFSLAYEELRRLAGAVRRSEPGVTLSPTALVNEAWLKLAASPPSEFHSPLHFKRVAWLDNARTDLAADYKALGRPHDAKRFETELAAKAP